MYLLFEEYLARFAHAIGSNLYNFVGEINNHRSIIIR